MIHPVHISLAKEALKKYRGDIPFASFLKSFFKQHKNSGSRDRKIVSELCFSYFRSAIFNDVEPDQIPVGELQNNKGALKKFDGMWGDIHPSFFEKLQQQPSFWIRFPRQYQNLLPPLKEQVLQQLLLGEYFAIELKADTKLEKLLEGHEGKFRVQDISSQRIIENLPVLSTDAKIWDCCSGSGGKSLLLNEKFPKLRLYVSDARNGIIEGLKDRFKAERKNIPSNAVIDLSKAQDFLVFKENLGKKYFDMILADVPCSGSGTWRRTPESFSTTEVSAISKFAELQRTIVKNAIPFLKSGGYFVYVTCSAFKAENEDIISKIVSELPLELYESAYYEESDLLYRAILRKK